MNGRKQTHVLLVLLVFFYSLPHRLVHAYTLFALQLKGGQWNGGEQNIT